jgi:Putative F0F1-ATPase subunit Ca2+/Mg2+ transporter
MLTIDVAAYKQRMRGLVDCAALDDTGGDITMGIYFSKGAGEALRTAGALSTVGLAFVLALVIGFWSGTVLDGWLGTKPVFTILFFFFGLAAGILNVYRIVSQAYPKQAAGPGASAAPPLHSVIRPKAGDDLDDRELGDDGDR